MIDYIVLVLIEEEKKIYLQLLKVYLLSEPDTSLDPGSEYKAPSPLIEPALALLNNYAHRIGHNYVKNNFTFILGGGQVRLYVFIFSCLYIFHLFAFRRTTSSPVIAFRHSNAADFTFSISRAFT